LKKHIVNHKQPQQLRFVKSNRAQHLKINRSTSHSLTVSNKKFLWCNTGVSKLRPAGQIRPAKPFPQ